MFFIAALLWKLANGLKDMAGHKNLTPGDELHRTPPSRNRKGERLSEAPRDLCRMFKTLYARHLVTYAVNSRQWMRGTLLSLCRGEKGRG